MFGRATIRLGIGPHSSSSMVFRGQRAPRGFSATSCVNWISDVYVSVIGSSAAGGMLSLRGVCCPVDAMCYRSLPAALVVRLALVS